ncbi:MAG: peptidoglycan-binding protein [Myxococcales bacterium]|nr:peptidoglycan-binding protein [Myxococcales bacterium]
MRVPLDRASAPQTTPQTTSTEPVAKPQKLAPPPDNFGHSHDHTQHTEAPVAKVATPSLQRDLAGATAQGFAQTPAAKARTRTSGAAPAAKAFKAPNASLKKGSTGPHVKTLQDRLQDLGFKPGPVDGVFGPKTEAAVKAFQKSAGEVVDGWVGPKTWSALEKAKPKNAAPSTPSTPATNTPPKDKFKAPNVTLKEGAKGPHVKTLQDRLQDLGFKPGPVDGVFGPKTESAVRAFQRDAGEVVDGLVGPKTWAALEKGKEALKNPDTPMPAGLDKFDKVPPASDYSRVNFRGVNMNKRTVDMIHRAETIMEKKHGHKGFQFSFSQGSYNAGGVSASAGTHDGGGALDIRTSIHSRPVVDDMVRSLRQAGFAAWSRGRGFDSFSPHIHAIAIGDRDLSRSARSQVSEYGWGGDGLVGSRPDPDRGLGRPIPTWAKRYI